MKDGHAVEDPGIIDVLARYELVSLDDADALGRLPDDRIEALCAEMTALATARRDAAEPGDVTALANAVHAAGCVLDVLETRPALVASAGHRLDQRVSRVAARRPDIVKPLARQRRSALVASGQRFDHGNLADLVAGALRDVARGGRGTRQVFSMEATGAVPTLTGDAFDNEAIIRASAAEQRKVLRASGGICAPTNVLYDSPLVSTDARPVRDSLLQFEASRGGVRYFAPTTLADVADGVGVWTEANDRTPSDPETKDIVTMTCPDEIEVLVEAITARMRLGNFRAKFWPENVAEWLRQLMAQHARIAEMRLVNAMVADSTDTFVETTLGTSRDVLAAVDRAGAGYRSRQRMTPDAPLQLVAPNWLRDQMRSDLTRQAPGDQSLAMTNAQIATAFAARNVTPTWSLDWQPFGVQSDGDPLNGWPTGDCSTLLFAPGTWLFVDGGTLDFGIVRDSVLNQTNDAETFAESFESVALRGTESLVIEMDLCPSGASAITLSTSAVCAAGS